MRQFGVKVWSKDVVRNRAFFQQCVTAVKEGLFGYIELFAQAGSFAETSSAIKEEMQGLPVVIHAPHCGVGMDTGDVSLAVENQRMFEDSRKFADLLHAEMIIQHPGMGQGAAYLEESIRQLKMLNDKRIVVENQPYECNVKHKRLHGITPEELKTIKAETGYGFCLDFYHAVCAANCLSVDVYRFLDEFKKLQPSMYHLCDGDINGKTDEHLHLGEGNFDLSRFLRDYVTDGAKATLETGREVPQNVEPWLEDLRYIKKVEAGL